MVWDEYAIWEHELALIFIFNVLGLDPFDD